ncbi:hypothetical protein GAS19_28405 [Burkholderia glumae]|nr:hypothetical protein GAS19_28405 [Burkholderia glumae]
MPDTHGEAAGRRSARRRAGVGDSAISAPALAREAVGGARGRRRLELVEVARPRAEAGGAAADMGDQPQGEPMAGRRADRVGVTAARLVHVERADVAAQRVRIATAADRLLRPSSPAQRPGGGLVPRRARYRRVAPCSAAPPVAPIDVVDCMKLVAYATVRGRSAGEPGRLRGAAERGPQQVRRGRRRAADRVPRAAAASRRSRRGGASGPARAPASPGARPPSAAG